MRTVYLVDGLEYDEEGEEGLKCFRHEKSEMNEAITHAENMAQSTGFGTVVYAAVKYADEADNEHVVVLHMVALCPDNLITEA